MNQFVIEKNINELDPKQQPRNGNKYLLYHNQIITFKTSDKTSDEKKFYRFVFYDRFLDPQ